MDREYLEQTERHVEVSVTLFRPELGLDPEAATSGPLRWYTSLAVACAGDANGTGER